MAVWSAWRVEARLDPTQNVGNIGAIGLALGFAILFADRGARWEQLSSGLRSLVAGGVTLVLWVSVAGAAYAAYLAFVAIGGLNGTVDALAIFACLCTIGSIVWLVRLRRG